MAVSQKPSSAFVGAAWLALIIGVAMYLIGLFNATMALNEKGYYLTLLLYGLFAAVQGAGAIAGGAAAGALYQ